MDLHQVRRAYRPYAALICLALVGCGGGTPSTSNNSAAVNAGIKVATFIDAPVSGLEYTSTSTSGVTDLNGNFEYVEGEEVTFSVGQVILGSTQPSSDVVRPADLVESSSSQTDPRVTRILRTLQSLDDNDDLNDGIQISSGTREYLRTVQADALVLTDSALSDDDVQKVLPSGRFTVSQEDAYAHYESHLSDESNARLGYESSPADVELAQGSTANASSANVQSIAQPSLTRGRLLASNCFQCHGTGGLGGFERIKGGEAHEVYEYANGQKGSKGQSIMTAHAQGFTRAQLDDIVFYLNQ